MEIPLLWVEETPSTNGYLKERFLRGELSGAFAVAARCQTAGRGRLGRGWESEPDRALSLSLLLPRALPATVTLGVGVAVTRAISQVCGVETRLKWPNDILCNNRKIGGILCEGVVGAAAATVIGIGINVAQSAEYFAEKGLAYGGSLYSETGEKVEVKALGAAVVAQVGEMLETLEAEGFVPMRDEFSARCVTLKRAVRVLSPTGEEQLAGDAVGVDGEGRLLVRDRAGEVHAVCAGEVSVRGVYGYV